MPTRLTKCTSRPLLIALVLMASLLAGECRASWWDRFRGDWAVVGATARARCASLLVAQVLAMNPRRTLVRRVSPTWSIDPEAATQSMAQMEGLFTLLALRAELWGELLDGKAENAAHSQAALQRLEQQIVADGPVLAQVSRHLRVLGIAHEVHLEPSAELAIGPELQVALAWNFERKIRLVGGSEGRVLLPGFPGLLEQAAALDIGLDVPELYEPLGRLRAQNNGLRFFASYHPNGNSVTLPRYSLLVGVPASEAMAHEMLGHAIPNLLQRAGGEYVLAGTSYGKLPAPAPESRPTDDQEQAQEMAKAYAGYQAHEEVRAYLISVASNLAALQRHLETATKPVAVIPEIPEEVLRRFVKAEAGSLDAFRGLLLPECLAARVDAIYYHGFDSPYHYPNVEDPLEVHLVFQRTLFKNIAAARMEASRTLRMMRLEQDLPAESTFFYSADGQVWSYTLFQPEDTERGGPYVTEIPLGPGDPMNRAANLAKLAAHRKQKIRWIESRTSDLERLERRVKALYALSSVELQRQILEREIRPLVSRALGELAPPAKPTRLAAWRGRYTDSTIPRSDRLLARETLVRGLSRVFTREDVIQLANRLELKASSSENYRGYLNYVLETDIDQMYRILLSIPGWKKLSDHEAVRQVLQVQHGPRLAVAEVLRERIK